MFLNVGVHKPGIQSLDIAGVANLREAKSWLTVSYKSI